VAVLHAGWRGIRAGILERAIHILKQQLGITASHLLAAVGPGLQKECFEVRQDVSAQFDQKYLLPHRDPEKKYLDLLQAVTDRLVQQGMPPANIATVQECTKCRKDKYYSYRRDKQESGRMMGIIGIRSE
jgi:copper oxidase (laccase) domain-containing protein